MAEHTLPEGRRWIANLERLAGALDYRAEPEFDVAAEGEEETPVDLAWFRSTEDAFPLFIFEIESLPSGQMTYNAAKVFSQDSDLFEKPLFHFHLMVRGGQTSGRPEAAQRLFGKFNYRQYRLAEATEATRCICDVLSQHRRVSDELDVVELAHALENDWPGVDLDAVWQHAEECHFEATWARSYAVLARCDDRFRPRYLRLLENEMNGAQIDGSQYASWLGQYFSAPLHAGILAAERQALGQGCLALLQEWQGSGHEARVRPMYGQSFDYDNFVFCLMPGLWALLAAMLGRVRGAPRWILEQMRLVVGDQAQVPFVFSALSGIWMLHIAAAFPTDLGDYFESARIVLNSEGGVSRELLMKPPTSNNAVDDPDSWWLTLQADREPIPTLEDFIELPSPSGEAASLTDVALRSLIDEVPPNGTMEILVALRGLRQGH
jgi:hypothetical protein